MINNTYYLKKKNETFSSLYNTLPGKIDFSSEWDHTTSFSSQHNIFTKPKDLVTTYFTY